MNVRFVRLAPLVLSLSLVSCRKPAQDRPIVVLGYTLKENEGIASDFATAFALDRTCKGVTLLRFGYPDFDYPHGPYWALDTFKGSPLSEREVCWSIAQGHGSGAGMTANCETSAAEAAHNVCFIANNEGGNVDRTIAPSKAK